MKFRWTNTLQFIFLHFYILINLPSIILPYNCYMVLVKTLWHCILLYNSVGAITVHSIQSTCFHFLSYEESSLNRYYWPIMEGRFIIEKSRGKTGSVGYAINTIKPKNKKETHVIRITCYLSGRDNNMEVIHASLLRIIGEATQSYTIIYHVVIGSHLA